jgi:membrane fusion protein, multidrug efflux system
MQKTWKFAAGALLVVAVVSAVGFAWSRQRGGPADPARPAAAGASAPTLQFRANEVVQPRLATLPQLIEFSGPLVAPSTAVVRAKAAGTLLSLSVAEGSRVNAGQSLGQIDLAELGSRVAERSALFDAARATLAQAERTHANNEQLAAQQFISPSALDGSRAALDGARANLQAARAALETTRLGQRDGQLLAPIAGVVAKRHVLPGEKVAHEQPLLTLVDLRQLELAGTVGTHEVSRLQAGMAVQVQVEGLAQPLAARLARIAPSAEPGTRAIGVTVVLANADERLRAGQYALARVVLDDAQQRLTLPLAAVGSTAGQTQVWTIADGKLQRRAVTLGRRDEAAGRVEVLSGLLPEAVVLAARFDNLREGATAQVQAAAGAALASAPASALPLR